MNRRSFLFRCLIGAGLLGLGGKWLGLDSLLTKWGQSLAQPASTFDPKGYYRIVLLGDPHLPYRERETPNPIKRKAILQAKDKVIDDINSWPDVNEVNVLGDIAAQFGIEKEYQYAKSYFNRLTSPIHFIAGNHDFIYQSRFSPEGKFVQGTPEERARKLDQFKSIFGLESLYYSHQTGPYRLLFLSPDKIHSPYLTEISDQQLAWLDSQLKQFPNQPTIIFFHAPLKDTLATYNHSVNTPNFIAQPVQSLDRILQNSPQVFLWVSGRTHTPATNDSYANSKVNTYGGHIRNIHTPDMDRQTIWTNSLYLYPDKVVIRTYNHQAQAWEEVLDRTIALDKKYRQA